MMVDQQCILNDVQLTLLFSYRSHNKCQVITKLAADTVRDCKISLLMMSSDNISEFPKCLNFHESVL